MQSLVLCDAKLASSAGALTSRQLLPCCFWPVRRKDRDAFRNTLFVSWDVTPEVEFEALSFEQHARIAFITTSRGTQRGDYAPNTV